jgi:hypothetical protein
MILTHAPQARRTQLTHRRRLVDPARYAGELDRRSLKSPFLLVTSTPMRSARNSSPRRTAAALFCYFVELCVRRLSDGFQTGQPKQPRSFARRNPHRHRLGRANAGSRAALVSMPKVFEALSARVPAGHDRLSAVSRPSTWSNPLSQSQAPVVTGLNKRKTLCAFYRCPHLAHIFCTKDMLRTVCNGSKRSKGASSAGRGSRAVGAGA